MTMLLKNGRVIDPANNLDDQVDILIEDNIIAEVGKDLKADLKDTIDLRGLWITPGLIDMHVHLREPGQTSKESIETGTKAARSGGFTSICCMPNTKPILDNALTLNWVNTQAKEKAVVNVFPICAVTKNQEGVELAPMAQLKEMGAVAFSEDGKPLINTKTYQYALQYSSMIDMPIISHAEDPYLFEDGLMNESFNSTMAGIKGIPYVSETIAIARELELLRYTGGRLHFAHISTARSVELIRQAKKEGLNVTCETAPHYFTLTDEHLRKYDMNYMVNPPLKSEKDVQGIIEGLRDGTIDVIATDHAPHTIEEKSLDILQAPCGMIGLETAVGLVLTYLVHNNILSPLEAIKKLTINPSQILKLNRGSLSCGSIADLTIISPEHDWVVDKNDFKSKGRNTPFDGYNLKGKALGTIVNGVSDFDRKFTHSVQLLKLKN